MKWDPNSSGHSRRVLAPGMDSLCLFVSVYVCAAHFSQVFEKFPQKDGEANAQMSEAEIQDTDFAVKFK